jgi:hypothetical protein
LVLRIAHSNSFQKYLKNTFHVQNTCGVFDRSYNEEDSLYFDIIEHSPDLLGERKLDDVFSVAAPTRAFNKFNTVLMCAFIPIFATLLLYPSSHPAREGRFMRRLEVERIELAALEIRR